MTETTEEPQSVSREDTEDAGVRVPPASQPAADISDRDVENHASNAGLLRNRYGKRSASGEYVPPGKGFWGRNPETGANEVYSVNDVRREMQKARTGTAPKPMENDPFAQMTRTPPGKDAVAAPVRLDDPKAVADAVHAVAGGVKNWLGKTAHEAGTAGSSWDVHPVFIADAFDAVKDRLPAGTTLDQFKDAVWKAKGAGTLDVSRSDMGAYVDVAKRKASEIPYLDSTFHLINVPGSKIATAPSTAETPTTAAKTNAPKRSGGESGKATAGNRAAEIEAAHDQMTATQKHSNDALLKTIRVIQRVRELNYTPHDAQMVSDPKSNIYQANDAAREARKLADNGQWSEASRRHYEAAYHLEKMMDEVAPSTVRDQLYRAAKAHVAAAKLINPENQFGWVPG